MGKVSVSYYKAQRYWCTKVNVGAVLASLCIEHRFCWKMLPRFSAGLRGHRSLELVLSQGSLQLRPFGSGPESRAPFVSEGSAGPRRTGLEADLILNCNIFLHAV